VQGLATTAWVVGAGRVLFSDLVPRAKNADYLAVYYGVLGLVEGISKVASGRLLDLTADTSFTFLGLETGSYFILFGGAFVLGLIGTVPLGRLKIRGLAGMREFAGMFFQGNPLLAMGSLIRYHRAKGEEAVVSTTESLGQAKSPLTVDELLEALSDPRFNVRFEAIIAIARMSPDERLVDALVDTLQSNDPAFSVMAAWGLGRMGDPRAVGPLRKALGAEYRSVMAHSARSLATLGDGEVRKLLLQRLETESDEGLRIAYSSALGKLQAAEATDRLLVLLRDNEDERSRMELALALARLVGEEHHFIRFFRHKAADLGSTAVEVMMGLSERLVRAGFDDDDTLKAIADCQDALEREDLAHGLDLVSLVIRMLPLEKHSLVARTVLQHCADRMTEFGPRRIEYALLALHVIEVGW
jgi:hypothetical protein